MQTYLEYVYKRNLQDYFFVLYVHHIFPEEFHPEEPSDDDEATIGREDDNPEEQASELQLLHEESKQTMEDLLRDLPPGYLEEGDHSLSNNADDLSDSVQSHDDSEERQKRPSNRGTIQDIDKDEEKNSDSILGQKLGRGIKRKVKLKKKETTSDAEKDIGDKDFEAEESEEDNEETIEEQEEREGDVNHEQELEDLQVSV